MKKLLLAAALCLSMVPAAFAFDTKAVVGFGGYTGNGATGSFDARMYNKCPLTGAEIVWGGSAYVPASKSKELGFNLVTGVTFDAPIFGKLELLAYSSKRSALSGASGGYFKFFEKFSVNKNYFFNLTDKVQVGLTLGLLEFSLDDTNSYVSVLDTIKPVVAANVTLF